MDFVFGQVSSSFLKLVYIKSKLAYAYPCVQFLGTPSKSFAGYDSHNWFTNCIVVLSDTEIALNLSAVDDILNVKLLKFV